MNMTDIEQKALELVNAIYRQRYGTGFPARLDRYIAYKDEALCRALEAHEADKSHHAAELREQAERFSEAAAKVVGQTDVLLYPGSAKPIRDLLSPFILAPVDPLAEAVKSCGYATLDAIEPEFAADLRAALDARGLAIVKKDAV